MASFPHGESRGVRLNPKEGKTKMKSWFWKGMLAAAIALPALSGTARAQFTDNDGCSNSTLKGDYGFRLYGKLLGIETAAGTQIFAQPALVDGVAMASFDGKGKLSQVD